MALYADAARFLSANQNLPFQHEVADVLKADATFEQLAVVPGGNSVKHPGGIEGAHHVTRPVAMSKQPLQDDGINFMRINEAAIFRHSANAVGIAIRHYARMALLMHHSFLQHAHVRLNGLWINAGKERIYLTANLYVLDCPLLENSRQHI